MSNVCRYDKTGQRHGCCDDYYWDGAVHRFLMINQFLARIIHGQRVFFTPRCSALGGKIFLPPRPTTLPRSPPLLPTALKDLGVTFSMPKVFSEKKFSHPQVPQVFEIFFPSCPRCFFFPQVFHKNFFSCPRCCSFSPGVDPNSPKYT